MQGCRVGKNGKSLLTNEYKISSWGDKNVLIFIVLIVVQFCEYTENHCIMYTLKYVSYFSIKLFKSNIKCIAERIYLKDIFRLTLSF